MIAGRTTRPRGASATNAALYPYAPSLATG